MSSIIAKGVDVCKEIVSELLNDRRRKIDRERERMKGSDSYVEKRARDKLANTFEANSQTERERETDRKRERKRVRGEGERQRPRNSQTA